jgi:membrane associated rhomboid family serine protease
LIARTPAGAPPVTAWATAVVAALCLLAFAVQLALSREQEMRLIHAAAVVPRWLMGDVPRPPELALLPLWLTPLSAVFLQPGLVHLSANLLWLAIFGVRLEHMLGTVRTALLMLVCAYGSALFQAISVRDLTAVLGASGIAGSVLGAFLVLRPKALLRLRLFASLALPLPAIFVVVGWFALDLVSALRDLAGGRVLRVAYPLHLAGFLLGAGCAAVLRPGAIPLFDKGRAWFSLEEWDTDEAQRRHWARARLGTAVLAGLYLGIAAAAIVRGRL